MITAQNLVKTYGKDELALTVLKNLNLVIESGDFVAIIGPSGAGKSTLMYQMSLLDQPTSGEIIIDGVVTSELNNVEKTEFRLNHLGYVFQDYALLPEMTAIENVALPMIMQGRGKAVAYSEAKTALEKIGLGDKLYNLPSQLSGGQQQRVSIARGVAHNPKILFADEPTANLDVASSHQVLDIFLELNREGQTIIMVTHEVEYAQKAKRVIRIADGVIQSDKRN
ncbi:MAG: ABC transporter ATP-binding protein [Candidatus Doudnabacteria bacterium]